MDQQPKIPTLKDSQKPQVKVRGMGIGLTLAERIKQFKKKDLAFILAGLGVLFLAPLAEHFMMAPESSDGSLQPGWSSNKAGSSGVFGAGGSPYDRTDGLAPGSPTGGGSDVITPLNVRDPSSLVMGPGSAQQPPTNSAVAPTPPSGSNSDLKDALAASARGAGAAAKRALLPVPKVALGGSGLRGLGVAGGGSSASASLAPISAANVPNRAGGGDSTGNARATKGYSGVARGQTGGGRGLDDLKAAAGKQAENMNRGAGAASDLNAAAQTGIPGGGSGGGGGRGGEGKEDKIGGNQDRGSRNVGESLDFIMRKKRLEHDLEREFKLKDLKDMGMLGAEVMRDTMKSIGTDVLGKPLVEMMGKGTGKFMGGLFPAAEEHPYCAGEEKFWDDLGHGDVADPLGICKYDKDMKLQTAWRIDGDRILFKCGTGPKDVGTQKGTKCEWIEKPKASSTAASSTLPAGTPQIGGATPEQLASVNSLADVCKTADGIINPAPAASDAMTHAVHADEFVKWAGTIRKEAGAIAGVGGALSSKIDIKECASASPSSATLDQIQKDALDVLAGSSLKAADDKSLIAVVKSWAAREDGKPEISMSAADEKVKLARSALDSIQKQDIAKKAAEDLSDQVVNKLSVADKKFYSDAQRQMDAARKAVAEVGKTLGAGGGGVQKDLEEVHVQVGDMARDPETGKVFKVNGNNKGFATFRTFVKDNAELGLTVGPVPETAPGATPNVNSTEIAAENAEVKVKAAGDLSNAYKTVLEQSKAAADPAAAKKAVDEAKGSAQTAIDEAAASVGLMRQSLIGWANDVKAKADKSAQLIIGASGTQAAK